ncbi:unnamed protein product, partial [Prorocentrum cordatum]
RSAASGAVPLVANAAARSASRAARASVRPGARPPQSADPPRKTRSRQQEQ